MKRNLLVFCLATLFGLAWGFQAMTERFAVEGRLQPVAEVLPEHFAVVNIQESGAKLEPPGEVEQGNVMLVEESLPKIESGTVEIRDTKDQGRIQQVWLEYRTGSNVYYCEYLASTERTVPLRYAEITREDWKAIAFESLKGFLKGFVLALLLGFALTRKLEP